VRDQNDIPECLKSYANFCSQELKKFADADTEFPDSTLYHYTTFCEKKDYLPYGIPIIFERGRP
jgi:hypothetical protein